MLNHMAFLCQSADPPPDRFGFLLAQPAMACPPYAIGPIPPGGQLWVERNDEPLLTRESSQSSKTMRTFMYVTGLSIGCPYSGFGTTATTLMTALQKRLLARDLTVYSERYNRVWRAELNRAVPCAVEKMRPFVTKPLSYDDLLDRRKKLLPSDKYQMYANEYKKFTGESRRSNGTFREGLLPEDCEVNGFVKFQKEKPTAVPRFIAGRAPLGVLTEKRHICEWEHQYYQNHPFFPYRSCVKEMTPHQKATLIYNNYMAIPNCVMVGLDFERFESGIMAEQIEDFHAFVDQLYPQTDEHWQLFKKHQINNRIKSRCGVNALIHGHVMSGDASTSLKNVWLVERLISTYLRLTNLTDVTRFMNDGDDCIAFVNGRDLNVLLGLLDWVQQFGMKMSLDFQGSNFSDVVFCQCRMIRCAKPTDENPEGWCLVRPPDKILRDALTTPNYADSIESMISYISDVGLGLSICEAGCPISQAYGEMMMRGVGRKNRNLTHRRFQKNDSWYWYVKYSDRKSTRNEQITAQARADYYLAFGYSPDLQIEIENVFSQVAENVLKEHFVELLGTQFRRPQSKTTPLLNHTVSPV